MQHPVLIYRTRYIIIWEKEIVQHKLLNFPATNQKLSRNKEETKNGSKRRIDKVHIKFIRGGHEKNYSTSSRIDFKTRSARVALSSFTRATPNFRRSKQLTYTTRSRYNEGRKPAERPLWLILVLAAEEVTA